MCDQSLATTSRMPASGGRDFHHRWSALCQLGGPERKEACHETRRCFLPSVLDQQACALLAPIRRVISPNPLLVLHLWLVPPYTACARCYHASMGRPRNHEPTPGVGSASAGRRVGGAGER